MKKVFLGAMSLLVLVCAVSFVGTSTRADAAVGINKQVPFYGTLADKKGKALSGIYDMSFSIYDTATGGTPLWTSIYSEGMGHGVSVVDGSFSVMLGELDPLTVDFTQDTYYLGITIENDSEMSPRERFGATPYAFNSDLLDGYDASTFLQGNSALTISLPLATSLITLTQTGTGDFMNFFDASENKLLSVDNTGRLFGSSIETLIDEENIFAGPLTIQSGDNSRFGGSVVLESGAGLLLGGGNGVSFYQDSSFLSDVYLEPVGESVGGAVRLITPNALALHANSSRNDTGDEYPALIFNDDGLAQLINLSNEPGDNARLELSFVGGTEVTDGGLVVSDGGVTVTDIGIDITSGSLTVADDVTVHSLAGNGLSDIAVDDNGLIVISSPSDARLKENVAALDNSLEKLLALRGVRYEWIDKARFGGQTEIGFIAQEVEDVVPEVVRENGEFLTLNTKNLLAVVVEAVKEMYGEMQDYFTRTERLEDEVRTLRAELDALNDGDATPSEAVEPVSEGAEVTLTQEPTEPEVLADEPGAALDTEDVEPEPAPEPEPLP